MSEQLKKRSKINPNLATLFDSHLKGARELAIAARSTATRRAYKFDWDRFCEFCAQTKRAPLPADPELVAAYVSYLEQSGSALATIQRSIVSISQAHKLAGLLSPTQSAIVTETLRGVRRTLGRSQRRAEPLTWPRLVRVLDFCRADPKLAVPAQAINYRNRALLLLGFAAALRRSEIVALNRSDIQDVDEGIVITIERSKTDQEGEGFEIGVPFFKEPALCPVVNLRAWLERLPPRDLRDTWSPSDSDPVFRSVNKGGALGKRLSAHAVSIVVKMAVAAAGYDPELYSGHSLRAGFATSAATAGAAERDIMAHTRHRSVTVARTYIRTGSLFAAENPLFLFSK